MGCLKVCSLTGEGFPHSKDDLGVLVKIECRLFDSVSHKIHMNMMTARNEMRDPSEEITFHVVKASG